MKKSSSLFVLYIFFTSINAFAELKMSSLPGAQATIFLDFDGHYVTTTIWNGGKPINCAPSGINDTGLREIYNRVSEDYRPFNVNITTDSSLFLLAPIAKRIRVIVTTTSAWYPGVGGVAFLGSFTWGDDTPAFVFTNRLGPFNPKIISECCSHETGHSVGLSHQSKYDEACALTATYNAGMGSGEIGWAPIMGNSYYKNRTGWNNGPTPGGCNSFQDNLTIITSKNGFTYRADDHSNDADSNSTQIVVNDNFFFTSGIITTTVDKDAFVIDLQKPGSFHFKALPFSVGANYTGANLDMKITVFNELMQLINVYDPAELLAVEFDTILTSGKYYIVLEGTGNSFSNDYGSLGSYTISGIFTPLFVAPIINIVLSGNVKGSKHHLNWNVQGNEPLTLHIERSADGAYFKSFSAVSIHADKFTCATMVKEDIFYRLKVILSGDKTVYSNVIILKSTETTQKPFAIFAVGNNEITVKASKYYTYKLVDTNGRLIAYGANPAGMHNINISNHPKGIYIMNIVNNNESITEKILKQ